MEFAQRLTGRDPDEAHRPASSLELLFDLCFVVAISQAAGALHHQISAGHFWDGISSFAMIFFAIWWAWMNFTWFASAYDTDDVVWRLLTFVQIAGVLVLASGVPLALEGHQNALVFGYLIMRTGLVAQWLRAAIGHPEARTTALRYAFGISALQVAWIARLFIDNGDWFTASFVFLALCELAVPIWAERPGMTPWHPEHIAERYGLFTLIVLGESVLSATLAVQKSYSETGVSETLVAIGLSGLILLFAAWWYVFDADFGEGLRLRRKMCWIWGYAHLFVFGSIAALGAGIAVAVDVADHHAHVSELVAAMAVAIPVAVFVTVIGALQWLVVRTNVQSPIWPFATAIATLAIAWIGQDLELPLLMCLIAVPLVALIVRGRAVGLGTAHAVD